MLVGTAALCKQSNKYPNILFFSITFHLTDKSVTWTPQDQRWKRIFSAMGNYYILFWFSAEHNLHSACKKSGNLNWLENLLKLLSWMKCFAFCLLSNHLRFSSQFRSLDAQSSFSENHNFLLLLFIFGSTTQTMTFSLLVDTLTRKAWGNFSLGCFFQKIQFLGPLM